jgi:hypothetical protein
MKTLDQPEQMAAAPEGVLFRQILVPLDGSTLAAAAMSRAVEELAERIAAGIRRVGPVCAGSMHGTAEPLRVPAERGNSTNSPRRRSWLASSVATRRRAIMAPS